jgi:hypothetical protein
LKKKILVLVVVAIIAVSAYLYSRPALPRISIDKVYNVTKVGDTVLLNVTLNNVVNCGGWMTTIAWDPYIAKLTKGGTQPANGAPAVDIIEGPFLQTAAPTYLMLNYANNTKGEIVVGVAFQVPGTGTSGTGVVLTMNFTILHVGTTTVEFRPPFSTVNQSMVLDKRFNDTAHTEVNGLITDQGPPPTWTNADFQETAIASEVVVLAALSSVVYMRTHRRPPKSARRKAELQPIIDAEDQR